MRWGFAEETVGRFPFDIRQIFFEWLQYFSKRVCAHPLICRIVLLPNIRKPLYFLFIATNWPVVETLRVIQHFWGNALTISVGIAVIIPGGNIQFLPRDSIFVIYAPVFIQKDGVIFLFLRFSFQNDHHVVLFAGETDIVGWRAV